MSWSEGLSAGCQIRNLKCEMRNDWAKRDDGRNSTLEVPVILNFEFQILNFEFEISRACRASLRHFATNSHE